MIADDNYGGQRTRSEERHGRDAIMAVAERGWWQQQQMRVGHHHCRQGQQSATTRDRYRC
jgi:hypothetical protein